MRLVSISTRNFRNLVDRSWDLHPSLNLMLGDNGQGKTNFLEAVHLLATTRSFRTTKMQNAVRLGAAEMFVEGTVASGSIEKTLSVGLAPAERKRELLVNGQRTALPRYLRELHVVAYASAQLEILRGGPEWRRRFIDRLAASLDPQHLPRLTLYNRVLRQRNALLGDVAARRAKASSLEPWDAELLATAAPIITARRETLELASAAFSEIVAAHDYHVTDLQPSYRPAGLTGDLVDDARSLAEIRPREIRAGHTLVGPHRDLLDYTSRGLPAAEVLSSGEIKMTVLFLTFAALDLYRRRFDEPPLFLLDDIDAELDLGILRRLTSYLIGNTQVFTTSAKEMIVRDLGFGAHRQFVLRGGSPAEVREIR